MKSALVAAVLLASATPAAAQAVEPFVATTDPADRALMAEVASIASARPPEIARLDAVLAKLPRPTPLRGIVQMIRAGTLDHTRETGPAVAAIEEAMRLLPDDARPKLVATYIFTFTGSPQRAADLWMEASRESPDYARMTDRYLIVALMGRLTDIGDRARADRFRVRLGEIGFSAGLANERSEAELARIREAVRGQHEAEALAGVSAISNPTDLLTLYVDQSYAMLWPRIAEWAGSNLEEQSLRYLEELRSDWVAADDFKTATPYARQLARLGADEAVVGLFAPMFDRLRPGDLAESVEFLAPIVARSLASLGRGVEAKALLAKAAAAMPADDGGNALNIEAAYLILAADQLDWAQVIVHADAFLARTKSLGSLVNRSAVTQTEAWRACALWRTGRIVDAQQATANVLLFSAVTPDNVVYLHLCRGDSEAARALVIASLADETTRDWALRFVQPERIDMRTPRERLMEPVEQAVRAAPDVIEAAKRVGRILSQPVGETLPTGFDPYRARPRTKPLGPGAI